MQLTHKRKSHKKVHGFWHLSMSVFLSGFSSPPQFSGIRRVHSGPETTTITTKHNNHKAHSALTAEQKDSSKSSHLERYEVTGGHLVKNISFLIAVEQDILNFLPPLCYCRRGRGLNQEAVIIFLGIRGRIFNNDAWLLFSTSLCNVPNSNQGDSKSLSKWFFNLILDVFPISQ